MSLTNKSNVIERASILFDQALVSGVNFLIGILLARYLGVEAFGIYAFIWMIILLFSAIQQPLFYAPFVYFFHSKNNNGYNSLYIYSQLIFACCSFLLMSTGLAVYYLITEEHIPLNIIFSCATLTANFLLFDFIRKFMIALRKLKIVLITDFIVYSLQITVIFILYINNIKISLYSIFWLLSLLFLLGYVIGILNNPIIKIKFKDYTDELKEIWEYCKWLVSSAFLTFTSSNIFYIVCGVYLGPASLGGVRATQNLMGVFNVLLQFVENYLPVQLIQLYNNKEIIKINKYLLKTGAILIVLLLSALVFGIFFSTHLYDLIYGSEYVAYSYLINWFIITYIFMIVNNLIRYGLRTIGSTKPIFHSYLINSIISLIAVFPLLKFFELPGLIFGIILTQVVSIFYLIKSYNKSLFGVSSYLIKFKD